MWEYQYCKACETLYNNKIEIDHCPICRGNTVIPVKITSDIDSLSSLYSSRNFDLWQGSNLGSDLFIISPERASRREKAAETGSCGDTHREIIDDWRNFLKTLKVYDPEYDDPENEYDITETTRQAINKEIDACEAYHISAGSIDNEIG